MIEWCHRHLKDENWDYRTHPDPMLGTKRWRFDSISPARWRLPPLAKSGFLSPFDGRECQSFGRIDHTNRCLCEIPVKRPFP
jgi:hypothetical protein